MPVSRQAAPSAWATSYEGVLRIVDLAQSRVEGLRIGFVHAEQAYRSRSTQIAA